MTPRAVAHVPGVRVCTAQDVVQCVVRRLFLCPSVSGALRGPTLRRLNACRPKGVDLRSRHTRHSLPTSWAPVQKRSWTVRPTLFAFLGSPRQWVVRPRTRLRAFFFQLPSLQPRHILIELFRQEVDIVVVSPEAGTIAP